MNKLTNKKAIFEIAERAYVALTNDGMDTEVNTLCDLAIAAMDAGGEGPAYETLRDYLGSLGYELPWASVNGEEVQ